MQNEFHATTRKRPVRHASFAMPRYAKVHQKPQRAHSFAQQRNFNIENILLKGSGQRTSCPVPLPELPRPKLISNPKGQYAKPSRPVGRSNSMQVTKQEKAKHEPRLSNKFQSCTLDELDSSSVLELGSLASSKSSEHSLVDALTDVPSRSINSIQTSSGFLTSSSHSQDGNGYGKQNYKHSFSSPTLNSIGNLDRNSQTYSSASTRFVIPEPDYAKPSTLRRKELNHETISPHHEKITRDDYDNFSLSSRSYPYIIRTPKSPAPLPPVHNLLPRISPIKPSSCSNQKISPPQSNTTFSSFGSPDNDQLNSRLNFPTNEEDAFGFNEPQLQKYVGVRQLESRITHFESSPLPVIEENDRLSNEEYDSHQSASDDQIQSNVMQKPAIPTTPKPKSIIVTKSGIKKPPRYSVLQKKVNNNQSATVKSENDVQSENNKNNSSLKHATRNSPALSQDGHDNENCDRESQKDTEERHFDHFEEYTKPSNRDLEDYNENSEEFMERISSGEMKRNKIILRVPSFRTAGCQTDTFRPVRRRASFCQTNLSVAPRNKNTSNNSLKTLSSGSNRWSLSNHTSSNNQESSSSSSGYSSPEASSKDPSPNHSGPPSPADKPAPQGLRPRRSKSNVTVIEINRAENTTLISTLAEAPPRPPKPLRLRHSAAADLESNGLLLPIPRRAKIPPPYRDAIGLSTLTENILRLTEAVEPSNDGPAQVHQTKKNSVNRTNSQRNSHSTPRVVDMQLKRKSDQDEPISRAEVFAEDGRTSVLFRERNLGKGPHSKNSFPSIHQKLLGKAHSVLRNNWNNELDWEIGQRWREEREKELASRWAADKEGRATAAYLASLELLASHYRHQALANAKVSKVYQIIVRKRDQMY